MTNEREDGEKPFLERWSRRKRELEPAGTDEPVAASAQPAGPAAGDAGEENEERRLELERNREEAEAIDLDSLDAASDYSPFFRDGVPKLLKSTAMRILWRSSPVFANVDGLNDYDEDFGSPDLIAKFKGTAWKIGKGYLRDEEVAPDAGDAVDAVAPQSGPAEADELQLAEGKAGEPEDDNAELRDDDGPESSEPEHEAARAQAEMEPDIAEPAGEDMPHKVPLRARLALDDWEKG